LSPVRIKRAPTICRFSSGNTSSFRRTSFSMSLRTAANAVQSRLPDQARPNRIHFDVERGRRHTRLTAVERGTLPTPGAAAPAEKSIAFPAAAPSTKRPELRMPPEAVRR
jgi:hypothetical protein